VAEEARPAEAEAGSQGVELGAVEVQEGADLQAAAQDVASEAEEEGRLDWTRRPRLPSKTIDGFYLSLSFSVAYRTKRCCLFMYYFTFTLLYFTSF
jgi:hypothetical protein